MRGIVDPRLVGAMLGLTPAESRVAALLAGNRTIRDIATETGRSEGTVRWHVKRVLGKLGLSRQVELVQLVMSLSDVPQPRSWLAGGVACAGPAFRQFSVEHPPFGRRGQDHVPVTVPPTHTSVA